MIPDLSNPQSWNRFSYVTNRLISFNDPTGHKGCDEEKGCNTNPLPVPVPPPNPDNNLEHPHSSGRNPDDELSGGGGPLISAYPYGPACMATVSYCTINETNNLSYLLGAGGSFYALGAASSLSTEIRGSQLIIYGTIASRNIVGIKPYTRHISLSNAGALTSGWTQGMWSSIGSGWTWLGIGISALGDIFTYANGDYTTGEFVGALGFDVGSGVISAAIGGAVTGGILGLAAGTTLGMGLGGVPGLAAGIILGALAGAVSYYWINTYKDDFVSYVGPGIDLALQANSNPNPYSGIMYP